MTDPRIEAAARALSADRGIDPDDNEEIGRHFGKDHNWQAYVHMVSIVLAAADAAVWRPTSTPPDAGILVHIASSAETGSEQAIALWDYDIGCWRNPDMGMRYAPAYFPQWQPLLNPPNATPQAASNTISISELRNDRPIPGKEG